MMEIIVRTDGNAHCVYAELVSVRSMGSVSIQRASHVEPDSSGMWVANLGPVNGPRLGPFENRTDALKAETNWLKKQLANWTPEDLGTRLNNVF